MNIHRLMLVRDQIAVLADDQFRMEWYGEPAKLKYTCGTAGCIAGWTCALFAPETPSNTDNVSSKAQTLLDLTDEEAAQLFCGLVSRRVLSSVTRSDAVHAIDTLIETGTPEWPLPVMVQLGLVDFEVLG